MLTNQTCTFLILCHLAKIYLPPQTLTKVAQGKALRSLVFPKFWPISSNLTGLFACHLAKICLSHQTLIKVAQRQALGSFVLRKLCPISSNLTQIFECKGLSTNCRSIWFPLKCSQIKFVHACLHAIWPKISSPSKPYKSGARAGFALVPFPKVLVNFFELVYIFGCQGPQANFRSICFPLKTSQIKFVHACFLAIWPKFIFPFKPLKKLRKGRLPARSFSTSSGQFLQT